MAGSQQYIAHAVPLDVMSAGQTPKEARKALDEAVHLFLVTAAGMGTPDDVLQESDYEFGQGGWVSTPWVAVQKHSAVVTI